MNKEKSPITTHVLDLVLGHPAAGIPVELEKEVDSGEWKAVGTGETDKDGRVESLLPGGTRLSAGSYRLTFLTRGYFSAQKSSAFFPRITIQFEVETTSRHYHVPVLLSRYGYSTYRGS